MFLRKKSQFVSTDKSTSLVFEFPELQTQLLAWKSKYVRKNLQASTWKAWFYCFEHTTSPLTINLKSCTFIEINFEKHSLLLSSDQQQWRLENFLKI